MQAIIGVKASGSEASKSIEASIQATKHSSTQAVKERVSGQQSEASGIIEGHSHGQNTQEPSSRSSKLAAEVHASGGATRNQGTKRAKEASKRGVEASKSES